MNFQNAIITGGSSGIGKATAKLLIQEGNNLFIIARDPVKLEKTKLELEAIKQYHEQKIVTYAADVSNRHQAEKAIESAIKQIGIPDLLITAAGTAYPDYFQNLPIEIFEKTMAVNYFGTLYCILPVLKAMEKKSQGNIVLISSGAGLIGIYGYSAYSPSKFAIRGLAESLRGELKLLNIHLSIVYPPDTDTPQLEEENKTKPQETKAITGKTKLWNAKDIAQEILKGIKKKSFIIAPGLEMSLLAKLHSVLLNPINYYFDQIIAKVRSKLR
jgi:3-dehydrosphinganine reductase